MLSKVSRSGADCALLDLEDSVVPESKTTARLQVSNALKRINGENGRPGVLAVRVNGVASGLLEADLESIICPELDMVYLAKTGTPAHVELVDSIISRLEQERGIEANSIGIMTLIETAEGVHNCYAICSSSKRVVGIAIGDAEGGDLCTDLGITWKKDGSTLLHARSQMLLEARAAGIAFPTGGPFTEINNLDACRTDAIQMKELGYVGKSAIHPSQVPVLNSVFSPTSEEIEYLQSMIASYYDAEKDRLGAINFRGRMIDIAMVKNGERILSTADRIKKHN